MRSLFLASARLAPVLALLAAPGLAADPKPVTVQIKMLDGLRFDPPRFEAPPGAQVILKLENADTTHQIHNLVVTAPGRREAVVQAALALGDQAEMRNHVPDTPLVLAGSALLPPEGKAELRFTLPAEKGVYPMVCTFPGHGFVMYGAIYAGTKMPTLAKDPNIPPTAAEAAVPGGGRRPFVQRMFLPDSGPAAIAVALPGDLNFGWDAGACRLRYAWTGPFIDASKYWASNGNHRAEPLGLVAWRAPDGHAPFSGTVAFKGYRLEKGLPVFLYQVDGVDVTERVDSPDGKSLQVTYTTLSSADLRVRGPGAGALTQDGPVPAAGVPLAANKPVTLKISLEGVR